MNQDWKNYRGSEPQGKTARIRKCDLDQNLDQNPD